MEGRKGIVSFDEAHRSNQIAPSDPPKPSLVKKRLSKMTVEDATLVIKKHKQTMKKPKPTDPNETRQPRSSIAGMCGRKRRGVPGKSVVSGYQGINAMLQNCRLNWPTIRTTTVKRC